MKEKKKILVIILIILFLIIALLKIFNVKKITYVISYENNDFSVQELHKKNYYYYIVNSKENTYPFKVNIKRGRKNLNKVYYYKDDNYECILPIISNETYVDMMCYIDNILYDYNFLKGSNSRLDNYVSSIKEYNYTIFEDKVSSYKKNSGIEFYNNDIGHNIYISTYKGIANNTKNVNIFENDVYSNEISLFIDKYYITANYNSEYEFKEFWVVNLKNHKLSKIKSNTYISFDSYIQGVVDNNIYIYDNNNENQFLINILSKTVKLVSSKSKIKYYDKGVWKLINKPNISKKVLFDLNNLNNYYTDYDKVIDTDHYFYLLKKQNNIFKLYRVDKSYDKVIKYICDLKTSELLYRDDYIFYSDGAYIYFYSDFTGKKTLLKNDELVFNKSIKYYVY